MNLSQGMDNVIMSQVFRGWWLDRFLLQASFCQFFRKICNISSIAYFASCCRFDPKIVSNKTPSLPVLRVTTTTELLGIEASIREEGLDKMNVYDLKILSKAMEALSIESWNQKPSK